MTVILWMEVNDFNSYDVRIIEVIKRGEFFDKVWGL